MLLSGGLSPVPAQYAGSRFTIAPYAEARRFGWEELENGKLLLQEIGMRYSVGATARLWFLPREVFFGELDGSYVMGRMQYDGARMDEHGTYVSYPARTAYAGVEGEFLLGSTLRPSTRFLITPVAGAGIEYWLRNLDWNGPYGYTEIYMAPSFDGGIRFTYVLETTVQVFSTFMVRYPLSISETFTLALAGQQPFKITLHPGNNPQYRASLGLEVYRFLLVFSYATWKLDRSDVSYHYYQPESNRQEYGVRVGYSLAF